MRVINEERFERAYREHLPVVFRCALQYAGRRDVAEDITSEAFLALYRNFDGLDLDQLPGWLITVVRNRARDYWRHREVEQRHAESLAQERQQKPSLHKFLLECGELKPMHRACLILRYVYGMTLKEIAQQTGQTATQIKGHLQYGRQLLRTHYAKLER